MESETEIRLSEPAVPMPFEKETLGQRLADAVAKVVGSWPFLIIQSSLLAVWIFLNVTGYVPRWDRYPFILMNLVLSLQAAYTAPLIMMSQNRQAKRDRHLARHDLLVNVRTGSDVMQLLTAMEQQNEQLAEILSLLQKKEGLPSDPPLDSGVSSDSFVGVVAQLGER